AAALLAFTIFFYVVVYTMWLKRQTPQNIVIGGAAGAFPPVIGWVSATGRIGVEPLILFLIIFLWPPPHLWALSPNRAGESACAGIPMLPVVAGTVETKRQILIYSVLLVPISILPWALGFAGAIYGATAGMSGAMIILLALQLRRSSDAEKRPAARLFAFSILYLFVLFATLLADAAGIHSPPPLGIRLQCAMRGPDRLGRWRSAIRPPFTGRAPLEYRMVSVSACQPTSVEIDVIGGLLVWWASVRIPGRRGGLIKVLWHGGQGCACSRSGWGVAPHLAVPPPVPALHPRCGPRCCPPRPPPRPSTRVPQPPD